MSVTLVKQMDNPVKNPDCEQSTFLWKSDRFLQHGWQGEGETIHKSRYFTTSSVEWADGFARETLAFLTDAEGEWLTGHELGGDAPNRHAALAISVVNNNP